MPIYGDIRDCVPVTIEFTDGSIFLYHSNYRFNIACLPSLLDQLGYNKTSDVKSITIAGGNELNTEYDGNVGVYLKECMLKLLQKYYPERDIIVKNTPKKAWLSVNMEVQPLNESNTTNIHERIKGKAFTAVHHEYEDIALKKSELEDPRTIIESLISFFELPRKKEQSTNRINCTMIDMPYERYASGNIKNEISKESLSYKSIINSLETEGISRI